MTCPSCGEEYELDFIELWTDEQAFLLDACCEGMEASLHEDLHASEQMGMQERTRFLQPLRDLFSAYGIDLRQVFFDGMRWRWDHGVEVAPVEQKAAKAFIAEHHRHNPAPAGWRYGAGIYNGGELVGVVWVGRPVARRLPQQEWVEVNRVCVRDDLPGELVWNACSAAYGWAAREAKRRGFERIITYTRADEPGTTLRAAGWEPEHETKAEGWNRPSRKRAQTSDVIQKVRWGRTLRPARRVAAAA